ncbi:MAG: hypothetical protein ACI4FX_10815 [Agathobacter sp.]
MSDVLKLTDTRTRGMITRRVYDGFGYRVSVTEMEGDKEIVCKPTDDVLYQPPIYARSGTSLLEPVRISMNRKAVKQEIAHLENAEKLMGYIEENFENL